MCFIYMPEFNTRKHCETSFCLKQLKLKIGGALRRNKLIPHVEHNALIHSSVFRNFFSQKNIILWCASCFFIVLFLMSQGAQAVGMGKEAQNVPAAAELYKKANDILG